MVVMMIGMVVIVVLERYITILTTNIATKKPQLEKRKKIT